MNVTRRQFLKHAGLVGVGGATVGAAAESALASHGPPVSDDWMGVLVDLTKCNGCRRCEAACQQAAGFAYPTDEDLKDTTVLQQYRRPGPTSYTLVNQFDVPHGVGEPEHVYAKINCMHCNDPACVSACLVGAMRKEPNGAVSYDPDKCMGCRYCMVACPFQMPAYEYENAFTPQVRKCTFCSNVGHPNRGEVPACVKACPKECLTYGKRNDLIAGARERIAERPDLYVDHIYGEHEVGGTSWLYLSPVPFEKLGFLALADGAPPRLTEAVQHGVFKHFMPPIAWCGILGLIAWLTRTEAAGEDHATSLMDADTTWFPETHRAASVVNLEGTSP